MACTRSSTLRSWPTCDEVAQHLASDADDAGELASLHGSTVIVTGSNTGIGKHAAGALASLGGNVIMACRNVEKGERAAAAERAKYKDTPQLRLTVLPLDLGSPASVRAFVAAFHAAAATNAWPPLDRLVLNAGIFPAGGYVAAPAWAGCEAAFAVNHLGHFLLTRLLLPTLRAAGSAAAPARVVVVASQSSFGPLATKAVEDRGEVERKVARAPKKGYSGFRAYGSSKLANVLFAGGLHTREAARALVAGGEARAGGGGGRVVACSLHPGGMIGTDIARKGNALLRGAFRFIALFTKSVDQGAATTVYCTLCPAGELRGAYFDCCRQANKSRLATPAAEDVLWGLSEDLLAEVEEGQQQEGGETAPARSAL